MKDTFIPLPDKTVTTNGHEEIKSQDSWWKDKRQGYHRLNEELPAKPGKSKPVGERDTYDKQKNHRNKG